MLYETILFARRRVNLTRLFEQLQDGDPFAWACLVFIVVGTAIGWYFKFKKVTKSKNLGISMGPPRSGAMASTAHVESAAIDAGPKCPVCQTSVAPNPGGNVTCPGCQAVFPSP